MQRREEGVMRGKGRVALSLLLFFLSLLCGVEGAIIPLQTDGNFYFLTGVSNGAYIGNFSVAESDVPYNGFIEVRMYPVQPLEGATGNPLSLRVNGGVVTGLYEVSLFLYSYNFTNMNGANALAVSAQDDILDGSGFAIKGCKNGCPNMCPSSPGYAECNGHGWCELTQSSCYCDEGYSDSSCSTPSNPPGNFPLWAIVFSPIGIILILICVCCGIVKCCRNNNSRNDGYQYQKYTSSDSGVKREVSVTHLGARQLVETMARHSGDPTVLRDCLQRLFDLLKADKRVIDEMTSCGAVDTILNAIPRFPDWPSITMNGVILIGEMANNESNRGYIVARGGINVLLNAMHGHASDEGVQMSCISALRDLALSDNAAATMASRRAYEFVIQALQAFPNSRIVHIMGCRALSRMRTTASLVDPTVDVRWIAIMLKEMATFPKEDDVQYNGCSIFTELLARDITVVGTLQNGFDAVLHAVSTALLLHPKNIELQSMGSTCITGLLQHSAVKVPQDVIRLIAQSLLSYADQDITQTSFIVALDTIARSKENVNDAFTVLELVVKACYQCARVERMQRTCCRIMAAFAEVDKGAVLGKGGLDAIIHAMRAFPHSEEVQIEAMHAFTKLFKEEHIRAYFVLKGGIEQVLAAMSLPNMGYAGCCVLNYLSTGDTGFDLVTKGGVPVIIRTILGSTERSVYLQGLQALHDLGDKIDDRDCSGVLDAIIAAMRLLPFDEDVQYFACGLLILMFENIENISFFTRKGGSEPLNVVLDYHANSASIQAQMIKLQEILDSS